jgi:topoisomerase-like DNA binding C4 zinc finger protein
MQTIGSTGVNCPDCTQGEVMEALGRGKTFYICGRYPECKFAILDRPIREPCPQCHALFVVEKAAKGKSTIRSCLSAGCSYEEKVSETMSAPQSPAGRTPEHAVIVHFLYGYTDLGALFSLEEQLRTAISAAGVGEYDGNEVAMDGSDGRLYMYGPDADKLFDIVEPILRAAPFLMGATATKRYGAAQAGAKEVNVTLGASR